MKIRIITAAIALVVFIAVLLAPPVVFSSALGAVIIFMLYECYGATGADNKMKTIGYISAAFIMTALYMRTQTAVFAALMIMLLLHMALVVFEHGKKDYKAVLSNGFLTAYVVFAMGCVWLTKELYSVSSMLLIFVCAWMTDTCAYFAGSAVGKHKLIPHVSPKKTVEGAIGGVIGAMISCIIYLILVTDIQIGKALVEGAAIGFFGGILSQLGDLCASAIKRDTGIKDFGWIFPGHGGFMDRFDSVMFIAPIILSIVYLFN